jgi:hypothetical protein
MAIKFAVVDYDMENLEPPILSVEEAVKKSSLFEVPSFIYPKQVGDILEGMAEADQKIVSAEVLVIYMPLFFASPNQPPTTPSPKFPYSLSMYNFTQFKCNLPLKKEKEKELLNDSASFQSPNK